MLMRSLGRTQKLTRALYSCFPPPKPSVLLGAGNPPTTLAPLALLVGLFLVQPPGDTRPAGQHPPLRVHGLRHPEQAVWKTRVADTGSQFTDVSFTLGEAVEREEASGRVTRPCPACVMEDPMPGDVPGPHPAWPGRHCSHLAAP